MSKKTFKLPSRNLENALKEGYSTPAEPPQSSSFSSVQEFHKESIRVGLNQFSPENAPENYQDLKQEVKFLEKVHNQSFIILAHRLKIIRDKELYKEDNYLNFKEFIEKELEVGRATVYNYINVVELFGVQHVGHDIKTSNLFMALPLIKSLPERKEDIFKASQNMGRKDFLLFLKGIKDQTFSLEMSNMLDTSQKEDDWYSTKDELLEHTTFLREGMKRNTTTKMLKELLNWKILEEPNNKTLLKMKEMLKNL